MRNAMGDLVSVCETQKLRVSERARAFVTSYIEVECQFEKTKMYVSGQFAHINPPYRVLECQFVETKMYLF